MKKSKTLFMTFLMFTIALGCNQEIVKTLKML